MLTTLQMTEAIRTAAAREAATSKSLKIDMGADGVIRVAGRIVDNDDLPADCTIHVAKADFEQIAEGELDPTEAFMSGKLRIDGDISVAMELQSVIGRAFG